MEYDIYSYSDNVMSRQIQHKHKPVCEQLFQFGTKRMVKAYATSIKGIWYLEM